MDDKAKQTGAYEPKTVEPKIYTRWMDSGYFNPDKLPDQDARRKKGAYFIAIAPPNITGSLHMGHALENTISDILIRYHRMAGYRTLWLPGTDHAGIATQNVVEKNLKKEGLSRHDLGREKFIEKIWEWREKYGDIILGQLQRLGYSLDWSRTRFTMDPDYQKAVKTAFEHYHKQGLIYQGERVINWCIKDQTALSDLELEYAEEKSTLWEIKYPLKDAAAGAEYITVATTRPETMLGDTAVAVHPSDPRYKDLIGKTVLLPIVNREIPIVADPFIDKEFGTGAVKVTPAHDIADSEIAERNKLPYIKVINEVGKIIGVNEEFNGLKIEEARKKTVEQLRELDLLAGEKEFTHNVAKCYRCGSTVEPMLSKQWFMNMQPLAEKTIAAIEAGDVSYVPERWREVALNWLENVRDWCISRQIWWGHQIPIEGSEDTFDTWFSSALWPFATLGWPEQTSDLKEFYPTEKNGTTAVITSGRDILHLWISRMIFSGLEFMEHAPFKDVVVHATILTKDGKRMSKSLGTGVDPLDLIEKYGADATRFGLIYQALGGQDIHFNEDVLMMGKKFSNKLWNIAKYVIGKSGALAGTDIDPATLATGLKEEQNTKLLAELEALTARVNAEIAGRGYNFGQAAHELYDFAWKSFADVYIEWSKTSESEETKKVLAHALTTLLKLLHPFMPFITEEIWNQLGREEMLIVTAWPK